MEIMRIGLDLAKNVFEVYGVDEQEQPALRKTLKRSQLMKFFAQLNPCIVSIESCGSAHHWARKLRSFGHEVRMMAPQFVAPYRKSDKNDHNDAEAICEAAGRPNMRFVPVKTEEQQAVLMVHRVRSLMVGERTSLVNQIRGLLSEFGIVLPQGRCHVRSQLPREAANKSAAWDNARCIRLRTHRWISNLHSRTASSATSAVKPARKSFWAEWTS